MREQIREMIEVARRVDVAHGCARSGESLSPHRTQPAARADGAATLGAQAVRLARLATIAHMDQAAKLRAAMSSQSITSAAASSMHTEVSQ